MARGFFFYYSILVQSEQGSKTTVNTRETHEGKTEETGREHDDSHTTHPFGNVYQLQLLTHTCKDGQCQSETNSR